MPEIMYVCNDCGHVFEHPANRYNMAVSVEDEDAQCPSCGSDDFDNAEQCEKCGEWFASKDMDYCLCKKCLGEAAKEHAAEYVMNDPDVRDNFSWWVRRKYRE